MVLASASFYAVRFLVQLVFYIWLLDYSILLKSRHDESVHESISLHHEITNQERKGESFSPQLEFEQWSCGN